MTVELKNRQRYPNISIGYPFNFKGVYRNGGFLFGKLFHSIMTKTKIVIGDVCYYSDILHSKWVAEESMISRIGSDFMIGSIRLVFVNDLIRSLYSSFGLEYSEYVTEQIRDTANYRHRLL